MIVEQAGVDTWSPAWYVREGDRAARALDALCNVRVPRGWAMEELVAGHRVGWFPGAGLVWAEGHPGGDRLGRGDELPDVLWRIEEELHDRGVPLDVGRTHHRWGGPRKSQLADRLPGFAGVRRLDVTADLRFSSGADGLAVLAGVFALGLPRSKCRPVFAPGSGNRPLETVAFHGVDGRKMLARWYDKGVEAGIARRGELIRPEDQRRFTRQTRRAVEELTNSYVRAKFEQRFVPLWQASKGVTVGGPVAIAAKLDELVREGSITNEMADKLGGFMLREANGCWSGSRRTRYRRRADLREHGLVMADGVFSEIEVDLRHVLDELLASELWGHG